MNPMLGSNGRVLWRDLSGDTVEWASLNNLAVEYWQYQRLSPREQESLREGPWDCVSDWLDGPSPGWTALLTALVVTAADDEVAMVGVHCVEDLLTFHGDTRPLSERSRRGRGAARSLVEPSRPYG